MTKNMGTADRIIRTLIAFVFGYVWYAGIISGTLAIVLAALAVVFLFTSLVSFCPLYRPLGLSTCGKGK